MALHGFSIECPKPTQNQISITLTNHIRRKNTMNQSKHEPNACYEDQAQENVSKTRLDLVKSNWLRAKVITPISALSFF